MKDLKPHIAAQRLLNLYRQYRVIDGGWYALNKVFLAEGSDATLEELENLPTGPTLIAHIKNLKSGKTQSNSIDPELIPFDGMMEDVIEAAVLTDSEMTELIRALDEFRPNAESLNRIKNLPIIKNQGMHWKVRIKLALRDNPPAAAAWMNVMKFHKALFFWNKAEQSLASVPTERSKAEIQSEMLNFENELPLFGKAGQDLLLRLKKTLSES